MSSLQETFLGLMVPGDCVVVRIDITATFGSNNNTHIGDFTTPQSKVVEGHGTVGEIIKVGHSVTYLKPKDNVAVQITPPNRECNFCKGARCPHCTVEPVTIPPSNTSKTYYILLGSICTKLEGLDIYEGALVEPIAIALNLFSNSNIENLPSNRAIIFGANFIGIFCCILANSHDKKVMVVDIDDSRLALAGVYGARIYNMSPLGTEEKAEQIADQIKAFFKEGTVDVAINASGDDEFVSPAFCVLHDEGKYLQAGVKSTDISFEILELFRGGRITANGNIGYTTEDFASAVDFLRNHKKDMADFCCSQTMG